ncbi:uncharacterized protein LOC110640984 isoform X2 [Hevea brasiliensis]|uniref:uncharacterized protein LOC110640984 isoform X2 n=1 Tax=Hevea brasiliensis TaxID=3981 RepID=UPI0025FFFEAF|nr:uncharacterized protein LOC110640984 isoform X2 [Hevea brasiliensis]
MPLDFSCPSFQGLVSLLLHLLRSTVCFFDGGFLFFSVICESLRKRVLGYGLCADFQFSLAHQTSSEEAYYPILQFLILLPSLQCGGLYICLNYPHPIVHEPWNPFHFEAKYTVMQQEIEINSKSSSRK